MWCKQFITRIILVAAEGLWHLGSLLYHDTVFNMGVIYKFTFVWYSAKQGATHGPTSHLAHLCTALSFTARRTWTAAQMGWWFRWPVFVMATLKSQNFFPHLVFQPIWGVGRSWLFTAFSIKFLTRRSLKSRWVCLAPREVTVSNCGVLLTTTLVCLTYFLYFLYDWHSFRNLMPVRYEHRLQWQQTDLKLRCDYCIKFHLFEGAQDVFNRLTAVCCMLLPHNPYRVPQHYK